MSYPTSIYCHNFAPTGSSVDIEQLAVQAPVGTHIKFYYTNSTYVDIVIGQDEIYEISDFSIIRAVVGNDDVDKALFTYVKKET